MKKFIEYINENYSGIDPSKLSLSQIWDVIVNKGLERWPEAEPYIMKDPIWAVHYANNILLTEWPEAEPYIIRDPKSAYLYAYHVMNKNRWPEAEPFIIKDPYYAYLYSVNVIEDRWLEAEPFIIKDPENIKDYFEVIKDKKQFILDNIKSLPNLVKKIPEKDFPIEIRNKYHELFKMKKLGLL